MEGKPDLEQLEERWAKLEDRLTAHVEAETESRAAQWRGYMVERQKVLDDDRASIVEQITAESKKLKQGFETHAENLKDLMAQSCRAGMARLSDLEVNAEELEAELASHQDMEDRVNKLNTLISDRLQNAANECNSLRARFEHLESKLKTAMGDRTHIHDELRKLNDEAKNQSDGLRNLEKRLEGQADELRADVRSHVRATIGTIGRMLNHLPEKGEEPHRDGRNRRKRRGRGVDERRDEACAGDLRQLPAATARQRLKARERCRVDESRLPVRA